MRNKLIMAAVAMAAAILSPPAAAASADAFGHPLYLYDQEQPLVDPGPPPSLITNGSAGNGDGVSAFGGTFSLVSP